MFYLIPAGHQHVVPEDKDVRNASQYLIHKTLERLPCVLQTKGHPSELKEAEWCDDSGLLHLP